MKCYTKPLIILTVVLVSEFKCFPLFAQESITKREYVSPNTIFLNALGDVSLISLNYERSHYFKSKFRVAAKIGIGYNINFLLNEPSKHYFTLPNHILAVYGRIHNIELGIGSTLIIGAENDSDYLVYPSAGYRVIFRTKDMGLTCLRLYGTILFNWDSFSYVAIPIGISIGTTF